MGLLTACADTATLNLYFDTGGESSREPTLILVVSMTEDGSRFEMNAGFQDQTTGDEIPFIELSTTQDALKGCAAYLGYIPSEDLQSGAFSTALAIKARCTDSLSQAMASIFPETLSSADLPADRLSQGAFTLANNKNGFVFVISVFGLLTGSESDNCFQLAAVKVQDAAFYAHLSSITTATSFTFPVNNTLVGSEDSAETSRQRCFPM